MPGRAGRRLSPGVDRDAGYAVTMYQLAADGYQVRATTPLAWVLTPAPADHLS